MGRNKTLPPTESLPVRGEIAGVNTASLGGYLHSSKKRARWAQGFHDELKGHMLDLKRNGPRQVYFARDSPCDENKQSYNTRLVAAQVNKDHTFQHTPGQRCQVCCWCVIKDSWKKQHHHRHLEHKDARSCRETPGTNTRNGQVRWNILGICEMRFKSFGETTTEEGHKVSFSGKEDKHEHGIGFLVHKDIMNTVTGCRPVTIRLRAVPINIKTV